MSKGFTGTSLVRTPTITKSSKWRSRSSASIRNKEGARTKEVIGTDRTCFHCFLSIWSSRLKCVTGAGGHLRLRIRTFYTKLYVLPAGTVWGKKWYEIEILTSWPKQSITCTWRPPKRSDTLHWVLFWNQEVPNRSPRVEIHVQNIFVKWSEKSQAGLFGHDSVAWSDFDTILGQDDSYKSPGAFQTSQDSKISWQTFVFGKHVLRKSEEEYFQQSILVEFFGFFSTVSVEVVWFSSVPPRPLPSSSSSAPPVLWLSTHAVPLTVPVGYGGQLMSGGPPVLWLSAHAAPLTVRVGYGAQLMTGGPPVLCLSIHWPSV